MWYVIFIGLFGFILALVQSWSLMYNSKSIGKVKLTPSGILIILCGIGIFIASLLQYFHQQNLDKKQTAIVKKEQNERDT